MKKYVEIADIRESMFEAYPLLQKEYLEKVISNMPAAETKTVRYWHEDLQRAGRPHKVIEVE